MVIDTLIVIVMLVSPVDTVKVKKETPKIDFAAAFKAADEAMRSATEKTKAERDKILNCDDMHRIVEELKKNSVKYNRKWQ